MTAAAARCDGQGSEDAQVGQGRPTPPGRRVLCMFQAIRPRHDYVTARVPKDDDPVRVTTGWYMLADNVPTMTDSKGAVVAEKISSEPFAGDVLIQNQYR